MFGRLTRTPVTKLVRLLLPLLPLLPVTERAGVVAGAVHADAADVADAEAGAAVLMWLLAVRMSSNSNCCRIWKLCSTTTVPPLK
jgi:hypothetical protein